MTINRTSTSLVRYLGTTVKANISNGKLTNVVSDGQGNEHRFNPSVRRQTESGLRQDTIKISDYQSALGYLGQRGVDPLIAKTMATVFVDVAKSLNQNVMSLLETSDPTKLILIESEFFNRINQLRDLTSQLNSSSPINNTASVPARRIKA